MSPRKSGCEQFCAAEPLGGFGPKWKSRVYNWCKDSLAPSIDGTVVRIEHHVDGVAVYVRSDDASRHVQPYAVEHLLRLVPPAYDDWGPCSASRGDTLRTARVLDVGGYSV